MGIFDGLKKRAVEKVAVDQYFKMLTAYSPAYSTFNGSVYEMALTRAAVHAFATHCGKLSPKVVGTARKDLERTLQFQPNALMDTYSFLYKLATILAVENTAFIIPILDDKMRISGFWPTRSSGSEIKVIGGNQYLLYESPTGNGKRDAIEFERVGVLRNHYYRSSLYGDANNALDATLNLMHTNDQAIVEGVKNSANIRFLARLANILKPEDIKKERQRFVADNLNYENNSGIMMFDAKYQEVKQIESKQLLIDDKQTALINANVFNYYGVNEGILQNKFNEEEWNAFYEGRIEPFAIQLSLVLTNMVFKGKQLVGNSIMFEANRLQYASNMTKINLVTQLFDRGFITQNQGLEVFNMAPVDGGDKRWIRGEYVPVDENGTVKTEEVPDDQSGS